MSESSVVRSKENVVIRAGACQLTLLPQFGGKIASIQVKGLELLQAPLSLVMPRTQYMPFDAGDASGWDECLPSVAACTVDTANGPAKIPDHGDLWRVEWKQPAAASEKSSGNGHKGSAVFAQHAKCFSLPLELDRTLALSETQDGWTLNITYRLTNTGNAPMPWSWAAHPLFTAAKGDRILLPDSIQSLRLEGSGGGRLGKNGDTVAWPAAKLAAGGTTDLSLAEGPESGIGDKLFAGPLGPDANWCALERPSAGVRIRVSFDTTATPYLGLWICHGGWPDGAGPKQTCVALEPATAPVDSLAETGPWSRTLAAGQSFEWPMRVDLQWM